MSDQQNHQDQQTQGKQGSSSTSLPARVRVSCPPLPLAPTLAREVQRLNSLCPDLDLSTLKTARKVATALAGGKVIGIAFCVSADTSDIRDIAITMIPQWRGRGIENALQEILVTGTHTEHTD